LVGTSFHAPVFTCQRCIGRQDGGSCITDRSQLCNFGNN
jgi:hypothetical protein